MKPGHVDRLLNISDDEIVARVRSGDDKLYSALAKAYVHPLYLWGAHHFDNEAEAEDAVSEILIQLWLRRKDWKVNTTVEAYLFGAVRMKSRMALRASRRHAELLEAEASRGELPGMSARAEDPGDAVARTDTREQLQKAIDRLPHNYRAALQLKIELDMSYDDIGEVLGITPNNAAKLVSRALQALRKRLRPDSELGQALKP